MKGIILLGGKGTRLKPNVDQPGDKQLLMVGSKPMAYYPIGNAMLSGCRWILLVCAPETIGRYRHRFGDGSQWGIHFEYVEQPNPGGLPQAFLLGEPFFHDEPAALFLGDNVIHGHGLTEKFRSAAAAVERNGGGVVFAQEVSDPQRFGVIEFDDQNRIISLTEKPELPKIPGWALIGVYFFDAQVFAMARGLQPSGRQELEIIDIMRTYRNRRQLSCERLGSGYAWLDTGTIGGLQEAAGYILPIEKLHKQYICCPEQIAYDAGWIDRDQLRRLAADLAGSEYGDHLLQVAQRAPRPLP